jgi:hypothetical protein
MITPFFLLHKQMDNNEERYIHLYRVSSSTDFGSLHIYNAIDRSLVIDGYDAVTLMRDLVYEPALNIVAFLTGTMALHGPDMDKCVEVRINITPYLDGLLPTLLICEILPDTRTPVPIDVKPRTILTIKNSTYAYNNETVMRWWEMANHVVGGVQHTVSDNHNIIHKELLEAYISQCQVLANGLKEQLQYTY